MTYLAQAATRHLACGTPRLRGERERPFLPFPSSVTASRRSSDNSTAPYYDLGLVHEINSIATNCLRYCWDYGITAWIVTTYAINKRTRYARPRACASTAP